MTKDEALNLALETLKSSRLFVMSRERIKQPEGADWYDSRITAIKAALAQPDSHPRDTLALIHRPNDPHSQPPTPPHPLSH